MGSSFILWVREQCTVASWARVCGPGSSALWLRGLRSVGQGAVHCGFVGLGLWAREQCTVASWTQVCGSGSSALWL